MNYARTKAGRAVYWQRWKRENPEKYVAAVRHNAELLKADPNGAAKRRAYNLRRWYGLSIAEYEQMSAEQEGRCYVCGREETALKGGKVSRLSVDHNHKTGKIRKLLCNRCNRVIGLMDENASILEKAAAYMRQFGE